MDIFFTYVSHGLLLLAYLYRLWFIDRKRGGEYQFPKGKYLIYFMGKESDSEELRKTKKKVNIITTINYLIMAVIAFTMIRQELFG